ncbi:OadG family protein [Eubacteriales bacterium OttesenSCG-928-N13]|nr:OadG family protein [Eubacteriales bacterium OttesenSCG-928-N13]
MANFLSSLLVMLLGMLVVFTGLIILIGTTKLMSFVIKKMNTKKEKKAAAPAPVAAAPAQPAAPVIEEPAQDPMADSQLVAAISAALMAFEGNNKRLVVRSVRRANNWAGAGRQESINY